MTLKIDNMRPVEHPPLRIENQAFHPVIRLPDSYDVYDFSEGYDPNRTREHEYGIGRYNEKRPCMYGGEQYDADRREIHVGIDIAAPVGEPIYAFFEGSVFQQGLNPLPWDYGPTIITRHSWLGQTVYALIGHLSMESLNRWSIGDTFRAGEQLATVGSQDVNGGWNPHVHFQLSLVRPSTYDIPGVVSDRDRQWALRAFPDPRLVLGPLYE